MKNIVIGTAGHIDHGKTSLIKALNGFEGDSTKQEKQRGITIDLSFSYMQNNDTNIAFIDVPGHEKLVKNMISGAFGFDAALVLIDAKEGIKPQTIEHLEILNFLEIRNIIIALSKADLVDKDTVKYQKDNISEFIKRFKNLNLKNIIPVSIYDNNSIELLKEQLFSLTKVEKRSNGIFRYYVDRSFSISGAGRVVTGTVLDGNISLQDKIIVAGYNKEIKIKNIQVHEKDVDEALVSQRVAINLQNPKIDIKKGDLLTKKGFIRGFTTIDVSINILSDHNIKHNSTLVFFMGTKQLNVKVLFLDPNQQFAKIEFNQEIYSVYNEPFILSQSGSVIAGGRVLNPINDPIKKKNKLILLEALKQKDFIKAFELLVAIHKKGFGLISSNQRFGLNHKKAIEIASKINNIFVDEDELVLYPNTTITLIENIILDIYKKNGFALLSSKSLNLKIKWASLKLIDTALQNLLQKNLIVFENGVYKNPDCNIENIDKFMQDKLLDILNSDNIMPKAPYNIYDDLDIDRQMGDKALKKLTSSKQVVRLEHNLFISYEKLNILIRELKNIIRKESFIDINIFKRHYPNLSRKYIIAYLEYLDKQNDIIQDGLKRKLS